MPERYRDYEDPERNSSVCASIWKIASSGIQSASANSRDFVGVRGKKANKQKTLTYI